MTGDADRPRQLLLEWPLDPVFTLANLAIGAGNRLAVEAVRDLALGRGIAHLPPLAGLVLHGEEGTGKTHLLQATVRQMRDDHGAQAALYLDLAGLARQLVQVGKMPDDPTLHRPEALSEATFSEFLARFASCRLVAVDGLEQLAPSAPLQEALLYLYNGMKGAGARMLFAGREGPDTLPTLRADLRSRLLAEPTLAVHPPDEEELAAILTKIVSDRQVRIGPELVKFLVHRLPRRVPEVARAIDRLDHAALQLKRPLTIPLAKEVLGL
ncbi:MAG: hypothetical protein HQL66_09675 [Magnetococcales bacterium]|nr:hypothetical protein [Magnetococcales bacterium]